MQVDISDSNLRILNDANAASRPDAIVHEIESAISKSIAGTLLENSLFPLRPGYGTLGRPNILHTNYLALTLSGKRLFCYKIHIESPGSDPSVKTSTIKRLVSRLLTEHFQLYLNKVATDYHCLLYSSVEIPWARTYRVTDPKQVGGIREYHARSYKVYISPTGTLSTGELMTYLSATQHETKVPPVPQFMQALDVIIGHFVRKQILSVHTVTGHDSHASASSNEPQPFGYDRESVGHVSIKAHAAAARMLFSAKARYPLWCQAGLLSTIIKKYMLNRSSQTARLENFLRGTHVHVTPSVQNYHGLRHGTDIEVIIGLANCGDGAILQYPPKVARYGSGPHEVEVFLESRQTLRTGSSSRRGYVTLTTFFKLEYHIVLDLNLPVINVGTPELPIYFPAEVCTVQAKRSLGAVSPLAHHDDLVRVSPEAEIAGLKKRSAALGLTSSLNPMLIAFGIEASPDPVTVYARVLAAPSVLYARELPARVVQAMWNVNASRLIRPVARRSWSWIYLDPLRTETVDTRSTALKKSLNRLATVLRRMGIFTSGSIRGKTISSTKDHAKTQIEDAVSFLQAKNRPSILLVILSTRAKSLGNLARLACDINHGMPAVEVMDEWLAHADQERYAKIGLKMNLKLGGENHMVGISDLGFVARGKTMVVGIHVVFAGAGSQKSPHSIAGLVASADSHFTQWPAEICLQHGQDLHIHRLEEMLKSRMCSWVKDHDNTLPDDIVIYRSTVPGCGYGSWVDKELPQIKDACRASQPTWHAHNDLPRITVVLVDEGHDAQFFPTTDTESHRYNSPLAGTVVDRGISEPRQWDFFLQSHSPTESLNRPTRYLVIFDEVFRRRYQARSSDGPVNLLQGLTHRLCYSSGESTKARRVCAPVWYARQACNRVRSYHGLATKPGLFSNGQDADDDGKVVTSSVLQVHRAVRESMFYL
ncbi:RNA interference and gene silencing protein (Qde2) [Penicillium atrosanguineum]|nr:RNA interference and gene silencing protein (Qde2) [Penicillium atrosanguineum]